MKYFLQRLFFYVFTAWAAITVNFFIPRLIPGDPVMSLINKNRGQIDPKSIASLYVLFGLDKHQSLWSQYTGYWSHLLGGDLGISFSNYPTPVLTILQNSLPWTVALAGIATVVSFAAGTFLGVLSGWLRGSRLDILLPVTTFISSIPAFWLRQAGADIWIHEHDAAILRDGPRSALRHAKPERSMLPYLLRRPAAITTPLHLARKGAFTAPAVPAVRVFDADRRLDGVPGRPQPVLLPGHTQGSTAYLFPERGLLFTGDALVTHDGLTGHTGPTLVCRGFTHDSHAALTSLDRLDELTTVTHLLPGHGQPVTADLRTATRRARHTGQR
ncbi:MBL fold metallo-hydrolase [Streptomyces sp. H39-C1]|uniref:MBL fold metallo-hydrolase n=1 Tax=Streptomyces sp. H39-C1 TaxID=3004355 RepID=UPI0022B0038B|nr:MBL fold metallo-hydrolase [Streptomyces sp. H39-C1]MCZ4098720.1 hypothetical protein [Streptomyces sp. H39-C1]